MRTETRRQIAQTTPTCWQREAPCPCLRVEPSPTESHVFPYQHLVAASLVSTEQNEILRLLFSSHNVELRGRNLRALLLALQDFAVKWLRTMPERYQGLDTADNGVITAIQIDEVK
jgi:hypothetical protein